MLLAPALLTFVLPMHATRLRTEYLVEPLAIQTTKPRFSWELTDASIGARQSAFQIKVTSNGKEVWDSGKVESSEQNQVVYNGPELKSQEACVWQLKVWNESGQASDWAKGSFRIGKLDKSDWSAKWITTPEPTPEIVTPNNGHHSVLETTPDKEKWVVLDLGESRSFDEVALFPAKPYDWRGDANGFMFPKRFVLESSDDASFSSPRVVADRSQEDFANPGDNAVRIPTPGAKGRYLRLRVTKLAQRDEGHFGFALAEIQALSGSKPVSQGAKVAASDGLRDRSWNPDHLTDGVLHSHGLQGLESLPVTELGKQIDVPKKVKSALFYATALGAYEATINGKPVGDHILAPEWTDYHTRVQYQTYDVTKILDHGQNAVRVMLGDGWYAGRIGMAQGLDPRGYPRAVYGRRAWFLGQLEVEYTDGSKEVFPTDASWKSSTEGPVRSSDIYDGEEVDHSNNWLVKDAHTLIGFLKAGVKTSDVVPDGHDPVLVAQPNEPIRIVDRLKPVAITEPKPGVYVVDMGQNMVGWLECDLTVVPRSTVHIQYAEMLNEDGTVYTENLRGAPQLDVVRTSTDTLNGRSKIRFRPHFTYHGFRYVQFTNLAEKPKASDLTGDVFCSSSPETATFETSDPMVNRLWKNIFWTQRANLMSSPTDCPQRDERLGWMGDILAFSQNAYYNMDLSGFFTKWLVDVRDAQADDGRYPDFAPHPYGKNDRFNGVPGWGDAGVVCAWVHYKNTGDKRLLAEHFSSMQRWVDWIASKNHDWLWKNDRHNDYGDWLNGNTLVRDGWDNTGGEVPKEVFATMMWFQSVRMVAMSAHVLGDDVRARTYDEETEDIRKAFQAAYLKDDGTVLGDTQAGYALALYLDLVPENLKAQSFAKLVATIDRRNGVLTTGFHSTLPMMEVLTAMGRNDLAYKLMLNKEFPSWGYTIENGATTIWERWDGFVKGRGFQDPGMNSFNHWALGSVGQWMMESVGGIKPMEPGWSKCLIAPRPGPGLTWCEASYHSPRGVVKVSWKQDGTGYVFKFTVPPNMTARVELPFGTTKAVVASGAKGLTADGPRAFEATSGSYEVRL